MRTALLWFSMTLALSGCAGPSEENATMQEPNLSQIGTELGVEFPAGCQVRGYEALQGLDSAWRLKLDCDAASSEAFLSQPVFGESEFLDSERYLLGPNHEWWDPSEPASLPTAQVQLSGARYLNVGVARGKQPLVTLYLMWHST